MCLIRQVRDFILKNPIGDGAASDEEARATGAMLAMLQAVATHRQLITLATPEVSAEARQGGGAALLEAQIDGAASSFCDVLLHAIIRSYRTFSGPAAAAASKPAAPKAKARSRSRPTAGAAGASTSASTGAGKYSHLHQLMPAEDRFSSADGSASLLELLVRWRRPDLTQVCVAEAMDEAHWP